MLLKFAYDGKYFHGYQRQDTLPTVEGEIIKVLRKFGIGEKIVSASRTDRGVSALGNVIWLKNMKRDIEDIIGILNSNLNHIYFHSYALRDINPRHARQRWYRYHILTDTNYDRLKECAKIFEGEHDFRNFTRARKNTVLRIDKIKVNKIENVVIIDFFAQYYLWNMIRRIVPAMESCSRKDFGEDIFKERRNFGLAEPHGLILMDVIYDFPFDKMRIKKKWREKIGENYLSSLIYYYLAGI